MSWKVWSFFLYDEGSFAGDAAIVTNGSTCECDNEWQHRGVARLLGLLARKW